MTAGSGDWEDMDDAARARHLKNEAAWKKKSPANKVFTYIGAVLLMIVIAFFGNMVLNALCLNVGSNPCG